MYLDLWRKLRKDVGYMTTAHRAEYLCHLMDRMEREMLERAKFEREPHKAIRHLRRLYTFDMEEEDNAETQS